MATTITIEVVSDTRIRVHFSDNMRDNGALSSPQSYAIAPTGAGAPVYVGRARPQRADNPAHVDLDITEQTDGEDYQVTASGLTTSTGTAITPASATFTGSGAPPAILRIEARSKTLVDVIFDESIIDNAFVRDPLNYTWDNGLTTVAVVDVKKDRVTLETSDQTPELVYGLTIPSPIIPPSLEEEDFLPRSRPWSGIGVQGDNKSRVWLAEATTSSTSARIQRVNEVPAGSFTAFADKTMMCANPGAQRAGSADAYGVFACLEADDFSTVFAGDGGTGIAHLRSMSFFGVTDGVRDGNVTTLGGFSSSLASAYTTPRQAGGGGYVGGAYLITGATGFSAIVKKDSSVEQLSSPGANSFDIDAVQMDAFVDIVAHAYDDGAGKLYLELVEGTTITELTTITTITVSATSCALEKVSTTNAIVYVGGSNGQLRAYSFTTTPGAATLLWSVVLSGSPTESIFRVRAIPGTNYLIACAFRRVYLIDKTTGAEVLPPLVLSGPNPIIYDVAFNDDDEYIYAVGIEQNGSDNGRLWKIKALGIFPT